MRRDPRAGHDAQRGQHAPDHRRRRLPDESKRNQTERDRKREIGGPRRHADRDLLRGLIVDLQEARAAKRQDGRDERADERGEDSGHVPRSPLRHHRASREGEQLAFARRNRPAGHSEDEREVRGERRRAGDAGAEEPSQHDLGERQHHDADGGDRRDKIFCPRGQGRKSERGRRRGSFRGPSAEHRPALSFQARGEGPALSL